MILQTDAQKFKGRRGTWYMIDMDYIHGSRYYLYESEIWGDDAAPMAADSQSTISITSFLF